MRRPVYRDLVATGFPAGVAAEDGVGLVYDGTSFAEAVSGRADGGAWRVAPGAEGAVSEEPIGVRAL
jgi:hypothetical protein